MRWRSPWEVLTAEASVVLGPGETKATGCAGPRTPPALWSEERGAQRGCCVTEEGAYGGTRVWQRGREKTPPSPSPPFTLLPSHSSLHTDSAPPWSKAQTEELRTAGPGGCSLQMAGFEAGSGLTRVARGGRGVVGFEWDD